MSNTRINLEDLLAYAAGELSAAEATRVEAVIRTQPEARATVACYRLAQKRLAEDDSVEPSAEVVRRAERLFSQGAASAAPSWLDRVDAVIARLVFDSRVEPVAVRFRDTGRRVQLAWEAEGLQVDVVAEREGGGEPGESGEGPMWQVQGQIESEGAEHAAVAILRRGQTRPIAESTTDDWAAFTLRVPPGRYELRVGLENRLLVLPELELG